MTDSLHYQLAEKAAELLGDGAWQPYERTLRQLMKLVPPGVAIRRAEKDRLYSKGPAQRKLERASEDQIYTGARAIVRDFLRNKAFESDKLGSNRIGGNYDRHIRMVGTLRALKADPTRKQRDVLRHENAVMKLQLAQLVEFMNTNGLKRTAAQIMEDAEQEVGRRGELPE